MEFAQEGAAVQGWGKRIAVSQLLGGGQLGGDFVSLPCESREDVDSGFGNVAARQAELLQELASFVCESA
jgi:hypothetical protein